jgi:hypothetical protein
MPWRNSSSWIHISSSVGALHSDEVRNRRKQLLGGDSRWELLDTDYQIRLLIAYPLGRLSGTFHCRPQRAHANTLLTTATRIGKKNPGLFGRDQEQFPSLY